MQQPINLDLISLDDLAQLRQELNDFFNAHDAYEGYYCDASDDWVRISLRAEDKFDAVRRRIRNLAIDLGIHAEFLQEHAKFLEEYQLTIVKKAA